MNATSRDSRSSLATTTGQCRLRPGQGGGELGPAVERVRALAGFHLDEFGRHGVALGRGEAAMAARWASRPRPDLPWRPVDTRQ